MNRTQKFATCAPPHTFFGLCLLNYGMYRQSEKRLLNNNISSTYSPNRPMVNYDPLNAHIDNGDFGHPSNFQRFSCFRFVATPTSLNGGQPNFARCMVFSWAGTLCIHFGGSCSLAEFCQVQYSLSVIQVLRAPILAALLHGTRAVDVSQTLRRDSAGQPSRGVSVPHPLVYLFIYYLL